MIKIECFTEIFQFVAFPKKIWITGMLIMIQQALLNHWHIIESTN